LNDGKLDSILLICKNKLFFLVTNRKLYFNLTLFRGMVAVSETTARQLKFTTTPKPPEN